MNDKVEADESNVIKGKHWLIVIIILFVAGYIVYTRLHDFAKSRKEQKQWTAKDRDLAIVKCIEATGESGTKYPELTRDYCECSYDKILAKLTKSEFLEISKKPTKERTKILSPILQDCLIVYQNAVQQSEK